MEDAKKAGTKNLDKFPKNMLFARAISNGVKWYTPDVFSGPVYVPEEMQTVTEDITHAVVEEVTTIEQAKTMINAIVDVDVIAAVYKSLPKELQKDKSIIAHCAAKKAELSNLNQEGQE
jgi:hypothetical protein